MRLFVQYDLTLWITSVIYLQTPAMHPFYAALICLSMFISASTHAAPSAFVLQDLDSGQMLMSSNMSLPINPGSLVELASATALTEKADKPNDISSIVRQIRENPETLPTDLTKSISRLISMLGMTRTSFISATITEDRNQASTAHDLARLATYCFLNNRTLFEIMSDLDSVSEAASRNNSHFWHSSTVYGLTSELGNHQWSGIFVSINPKTDQTVRRLLVVILNAEDASDLADTTSRLITEGNLNFETLKAVRQGEIVGSLPIFKGESDNLKVAAATDAVITLKRSDLTEKASDAFTIRMTCRLPITAPVKEGTEIGRLEVLFHTQSLVSVPVVAAESIREGNFWKRVIDTIRMASRKP